MRGAENAMTRYEKQNKVVLSTDELRKDLAGMSHEAHAFESPGAGIYREEFSELVYRELMVRARQLLQRGESVLLDGSWTRAVRRAAARELAASKELQLVELRCVLDPAQARERVARRLATMFDPSDATPPIADFLAATAEAWPESHCLDTSQPLAAVVAEAARVLTSTTSR